MRITAKRIVSAQTIRPIGAEGAMIPEGTFVTCTGFRAERKGRDVAPANATHCDVSFLDGMKSRWAVARMEDLKFI